ncbi:MAG: hypothetical protein Q8R92_15395 [Deltaproteobacteria bacterium]|nr:hypothetical protein [Deltaproteobacteria bacterium]
MCDLHIWTVAARALLDLLDPGQVARRRGRARVERQGLLVRGLRL